MSNRRRGGSGAHARRPAAERQVVVCFHAHPDDEALLTGGTLARLSAGGHRVVLVVATSGEAGLAPGEIDDLGGRRVQELRRSADALGVSRVVLLGYADSGWSPEPGFTGNAESFATIDAAGPAEALADVLRAEGADLLITYDRNGGYGHPDHVRVHEVGRLAAEQASTARVLEATVDRTLLRRGVRALSTLRLVPDGTPMSRVDSWYAGRDEITHKVGVRPYWRQKRAAMAAHASQAGGGDGPRTLSILLRLPGPVFRRLCGTEWFIESGAPVPVPAIDDPLVAVVDSEAA